MQVGGIEILQPVGQRANERLGAGTHAVAARTGVSYQPALKNKRTSARAPRTNSGFARIDLQGATTGGDWTDRIKKEEWPH